MSANEPEQDCPSARELESLSLLAETLPPSTPARETRERLLEALQGPERWSSHAAQVSRYFGLAFADALDALTRIPRSEEWQPGMWRSSRWLRTPALLQRSALIAELPAGFCFARHRHHTRELTYVLDGELVEDGQHLHGSGSFLEKARDTEHEVVVTERGPCLVVFALPTD